MGRTADFLRNFGRIFTLNYDLLLYWTLVQPGNGLSRSFRDGFTSADDILEWKDFPNQEVLYLHGALHFFQQNGRLEKVKYQADEPQGRLIQQIAQRVNDGRAPLFVCEGTNQQKLLHISSSRYLRFCLKTLTNCNVPMFIFGHSLADSDQHIADAISSSQIGHVFVSLYGSPDSEHNKAIRRKAEDMKSARQYPSLELTFYDAESAHVW